MKLSEAVKLRIDELKEEHKITEYKLSDLVGAPRSTYHYFATGHYDKVVLNLIKDTCDVLDISLVEFFNSPLFAKENLTD